MTTLEITPGSEVHLQIGLGVETPGGVCAIENPRVEAESEGRDYTLANISSHPTRDSIGSYIEDKPDGSAWGGVSFTLPDDDSLWGKRVTVKYEVEAFYPVRTGGAFFWATPQKQSLGGSTFLNIIPKNVSEHSSRLWRAWIAVLSLGFVACVFIVRRYA